MKQILQFRPSGILTTRWEIAVDIDTELRQGDRLDISLDALEAHIMPHPDPDGYTNTNTVVVTCVSDIEDLLLYNEWEILGRCIDLGDHEEIITLVLDAVG